MANLTGRLVAYIAWLPGSPDAPALVAASSSSQARACAARALMDAHGCTFGEALKRLTVRRAYARDGEAARCAAPGFIQARRRA